MLASHIEIIEELIKFQQTPTNSSREKGLRYFFFKRAKKYIPFQRPLQQRILSEQQASIKHFEGKKNTSSFKIIVKKQAPKSLNYVECVIYMSLVSKRSFWERIMSLLYIFFSYSSLTKDFIFGFMAIALQIKSGN